METCAYLYQDEQWVGFKNPTPSELKSLRSRGAVVLRKQVIKQGNKIYTTWLTDNDVAVVEKVDNLND